MQQMIVCKPQTALLFQILYMQQYILWESCENKTYKASTETYHRCILLGKTIEGYLGSVSFNKI